VETINRTRTGDYDVYCLIKCHPAGIMTFPLTSWHFHYCSSWWHTVFVWCWYTVQSSVCLYKTFLHAFYVSNLSSVSANVRMRRSFTKDVCIK